MRFGMYLSGVTGFCVHVFVLEVAKGHGDQGRRFRVLPNLSLRHMKSGVSAVHILGLCVEGLGRAHLTDWAVKVAIVIVYVCHIA